MEFTDRLENALRIRRMTQAAVAEQIGISAAAVSGWLSGSKSPTSKNVEALAEVLGVTASWLQFGEGNGPTVDPSVEREAYRNSVEWYHREAPKDRGREMGNAAGFAFEHDLRTLARETGQNFGDEPVDRDLPVRGVYDVIELRGDDLDSFLDALKFDDLRPHLEAAATGGQKASQVLRAGLDSLASDGRLILIRIADYNATGLVGPEYDSGNFMAVCRNTLDSHKSSQTAGGSYGLGKATMWASSWMGLVLTNSRLSVEEEGQVDNRFFARLEVPWHEVDGKQFAGPAWYGEADPEMECTRSVFGNGTLADDLYVSREENSPGATFLVVGAFDPSGEADTPEAMSEVLTRALAENFWAALAPRGSGREPKMALKVRTFRGRNKLTERIVDPSDYRPELVEALRKHYDDEVVDRLDEAGDVFRTTVPLNVPERLEPDGHGPAEHEAVLLVVQAADAENASSAHETLNSISRLRGNNMTIKEDVLSAVPLGARPFHAIVLAGTASDTSAEVDPLAERFLRAAEPPAHDRWTSTPEVTTSYARGGVKNLTDFEKGIKGKIVDAIRAGVSDASDGPESLKQLLRLVTPSESPKKLKVTPVGKPIRREDGAWEVAGRVAIPARTGPWRFTPVLKFGTDSGPAVPVAWESVTAVSGCEKGQGDSLVTQARARSAQFTAVTDPESHPVSSEFARVGLDLKGSREEVSGR